MSELEFFFDVGSPYSYLASTQVPGLVERTGASVSWRPFLLGGVFQLSGNDMPARVANKGKWMLADLARWAAIYEVPFRMSPHFPVNTLSAQRTLLAAQIHHGPEAVPTLAQSFFRGLWQEGADLSDGDEIAFRVNQSGLDAKALMRMVGDPELKQSLKDVTEEAVKRGAFGAPSFFLDGALYFGNDRLDMLEAALMDQGPAIPAEDR